MHIFCQMQSTYHQVPCQSMSIITIYSYFSRFTVSVTISKQFCEDTDVEYKKLLRYSKVRWLALTPAIEHVLQSFESLFLFFKTDVQKFFNLFSIINYQRYLLMHFVHHQSSIFHKKYKS